MAASPVSVLPVLDLVGEVVLGPVAGESGCPKFLGPGGEKGHSKGPLASDLAALYLLPYLMGADFAHQLLTTRDRSWTSVPVLRTGTEQQQSTALVSDGQAFARSHSVSRAEGASDAA
jgi:hypothetical protein